MKKLLGILVLGLFLITPSQADDIRDFQIEGMSVGDSLLDYFSKSEIKKGKKNYFKDNFSLFVELFYGQFASKTKCPSCKYTSYAYDPFCFLTLPLPSGSILNSDSSGVDIYNVIQTFCTNECLDDENKWRLIFPYLLHLYL